MYEVNRSVFLLIPLDPFWNWLQSLSIDLSEYSLEDLQADANAYLVNPCDNADEVWTKSKRASRKFLPPSWPIGVKTKASGRICTPIFSTSGSTSSSLPC